MSLDFEPVFESWQFLAGGLLQTLALSGLTIVLSVILGSAIGLARCYGQIGRASCRERVC